MKAPDDRSGHTGNCDRGKGVDGEVAKYDFKGEKCARNRGVEGDSHSGGNGASHQFARGDPVGANEV